MYVHEQNTLVLMYALIFKNTADGESEKLSQKEFIRTPGYAAQGDYAGNHNRRRNDSKTSQPVKFGSKKITNGPAGIRAFFFFSPKDFFVHLFQPHWPSKRRHL